MNHLYLRYPQFLMNLNYLTSPMNLNYLKNHLYLMNQKNPMYLQFLMNHSYLMYQRLLTKLNHCIYKYLYLLCHNILHPQPLIKVLLPILEFAMLLL